MSTLSQLIGPPQKRGEGGDPFLRKYGLGRNPFPAARTIIEQVMFNQDESVSKFASLVRDAWQPEPQRGAIGIVGGTGGGKTHFLRYCQHSLREYMEEGNSRPIAIVEVLAGSSSAVGLLRDVVRAADDAAKLSGEYDLLTGVVRAVDDGEELSVVKQSDLKAVLERLFLASRPGYVPTDRARQQTFEPLRDLAKKWLAGATLTATERTHLGVFSRLGSAAIMARVMSELLTLARTLDLIEGVVLCLDEIETLFQSGLTTAKVQSFLQDVRYLFDEAVKGGGGYTLLVLAASTQSGTSNLRTYSYPLYQRLGFEGDARAELAPLKSVTEVKEIARLYIDYEFDRAKVGVGTKTRARSLVDDDDLENAFDQAATADRSSPRSGTVNQGQLLQALHAIVDAKRSA